MLGILLGLVLVEQSYDLAHHRMDRFRLVADWLGDRNDPNTVLGQLAKVKLLFECFAKEAAVAVDYDDIERVVTIACPLNHLLKDSTAIVTPRSASLYEFANDVVVVGSAPRTKVPLLVRNREIMLGLPAG